MKRFSWTVLLILCVVFLPISVARADAAQTAEQWKVFETSFESSIKHENPFLDVQADVVFAKEGTEWKQPAFWNGGQSWTVRFAFPETGTFSWRVESNDPVGSK